MKRFHLFFLLASIAGVSPGAFFLLTMPAQAKQCSTERPSSRSHWSYRLIDGRKCWYEGTPMLSKSSLHWSLARQTDLDRESNVSSSELLQSSRCSGIRPGRFRRFRCALALALPRSNRKIIAGDQPRLPIPKNPAGWCRRALHTIRSRKTLRDGTAIVQIVTADSQGLSQWLTSVNRWALLS